MSYQALARKYRPQRFDEIVGHEGTKKALINALDQKKLHHTYLFTGTRGVGKTSLLRLFAKCLSCEEKITSTPCGSCGCCRAMQDNQFVDLIEIDAASRTRVEDIQHLLENIQYKPTLARYKVYLIDEIHMLSSHSFSALLKTLEEPPQHVMFLLATTDPQKVPDTIISRCLHFPLSELNTEEITQQLETLLDHEKVAYEVTALQEVAKLAKGSIRDALSLIEPLILHGKNHVTLKDVAMIYGYIDTKDVWAFIKAIQEREISTLKKLTHSIAMCSVDFEKVLDTILETLHEMAWAQQCNFAGLTKQDKVSLEMTDLCHKISPEQIQLYYQIGLMGKKDLSLAPTAQLGFEMTLLRMAAFIPSTDTSLQHSNAHSLRASTKPSSDAPNSLDWPALVKVLPLSGFLKSLALNCELKSFDAKILTLSLDVRQKILYSQEREALLENTLCQHFKKDLKLRICIEPIQGSTSAALTAQKERVEKEKLYGSILESDDVKKIQEMFDATIDIKAIQLNSEKYHE